jgi:glucose-6-phosphate 1-dehydrogenase
VTSQALPLDAFDLVIFGGTGDLARRKLLPALLQRFADGQIVPQSRIIATARDALSPDDYRKRIRAELLPAIESDDAAREALDGFLGRVDYRPLDATRDAGWPELAAALDGPAERVRVFYLATSPDLFAGICERLRASGLSGGNSRVVIEKPIGRDLRSAKSINDAVGRAFDEGQTFRIDHYLGKETVQNLLALRFGNALFEPLWKAEHIDHVQITVAETIGVGQRAGYYDNAGALRDMVQNHMLQLLTLVCMEPPSTFQADKVRDEKVKVLDAIQPPTSDEVAEMTVRAQYAAGSPGGEDVPGYLDEDGVPDDSQTETYAALRLEVHNWRWEGVPFFLRTGKRLSRKTTEIAVQLKPVPHLAFASDGSVGVQPNLLILAVQPNEGVSLSLGAKIPGSRMRIRPVNMEFLYGSSFMSQSPEAYERLIQDAMRGEATLFTRDDEVIAQWSIIDPILKAWQEGEPPKAEYAAGSPGPSQADELIAPRKWRGL